MPASRGALAGSGLVIATGRGDSQDGFGREIAGRHTWFTECYAPRPTIVQARESTA